jgi:protein gp37
MPTGISYLDETWGLVLGCTHASDGCRFCWSEGVSHAHASHPNPKIASDYGGITKDGKWTGEIKCMEDRLSIPLHWKKPRRVGVSFMGDLFHPKVPFAFIDKVFAVMALCPQHTFIILTKRPERMREYITWKDYDPLEERWDMVNVAASLLKGRENLFDEIIQKGNWPLANVQLGVSVEDQATADERIPLLLQTPAATRIVSYEPALGPVSFRWMPGHNEATGETYYEYLKRKGSIEYESLKMLDQIIMGGESGPNARPMHPDWARSVQKQCHEAGVPFYFKQWGEWVRSYEAIDMGLLDATIVDKKIQHIGFEGTTYYRFGKKAAGHLLDGKEYREMI